jgi:hypothetical protein
MSSSLAFGGLSAGLDVDTVDALAVAAAPPPPPPPAAEAPFVAVVAATVGATVAAIVGAIVAEAAVVKSAAAPRIVCLTRVQLNGWRVRN